MDEVLISDNRGIYGTSYKAHFLLLCSFQHEGNSRC